jgi:hypothetical protein
MTPALIAAAVLIAGVALSHMIDRRHQGEPMTTPDPTTPTATANVYPVLAAITQAPAWGVMVDGRLVATCSTADDAHTVRRLINEAGGL